MKKTCLIILSGRLSECIQKGEVLRNYYNPGNYFDEIIIMLTNNDKPDVKEVQSMVGSAKLSLVSFPEPPGFFKWTLGWQRFLIQDWLKKAELQLVEYNFDVIRCYGTHLNLVLGAYFKKRFKKPLLVSLHTHPELDSHKQKRSLKNTIINYFEQKLSRYLTNADLVIPVYIGITDFLKKMKIKKYTVLYNQVGISSEDVKKDFSYLDPFKMICVGQQIPNKDPSNLIRAVALIPNVTLDIIGKGVLNTRLKHLVNELNVENRIHFIDSVPYHELCARYKNYDAFAASIDCIGISKAVIEAFLARLPVLLNWNTQVQVPELSKEICLRVTDSVEGYVEGINNLMSSQSLREEMSLTAFDHAMKLWKPSRVEQEHIHIYEGLLTK